MVYCDSRSETKGNEMKICNLGNSSVWRALRCETQSHRESMLMYNLGNINLQNLRNRNLSMICEIKICNLRHHEKPVNYLQNKICNLRKRNLLMICEIEICNFPKRNLFMICETGRKAPQAKRTNRSVHHKCGCIK